LVLILSKLEFYYAHRAMNFCVKNGFYDCSKANGQKIQIFVMYLFIKLKLKKYDKTT